VEQWTKRKHNSEDRRVEQEDVVFLLLDEKEDLVAQGDDVGEGFHHSKSRETVASKRGSPIVRIKNDINKNKGVDGM